MEAQSEFDLLGLSRASACAQSHGDVARLPKHGLALPAADPGLLGDTRKRSAISSATS